MVIEPRQRLTFDARRQSILDAARAVFARHGFHGAGTSEIARRAGCSEPMLYKHFVSKQALFAAVLDDATAQLKQRIHPMFEECDNELVGLAAIVGRLAHDPLMIEVSRLRMLAITLTDDPEIRSALERSVSEMRKRVVAAVASMQQRGLARADVDADQVGWLWLGFVLVGGFRLAVEGPDVASELPKIPQTLLALLRDPTHGDADQ
jgi:AcrR family transcriptional regulator